MREEAVHLLKNRFHRNANLYLLLIPIILFSIILAFFVAGFSRPTVLGETSTELDKASEIR